jgi:RNA polymerase primary sigma factor
MRELYSKIRLFEERFLKGQPIQLSQAKQYLEELLETPIKDEFMKHFLLEKGYKLIEECSTAGKKDVNVGKEEEDQDDLDFDAILSQKWEPKRKVSPPTNAKNSYLANTQLLQEYHEGSDMEYARNSLIENNIKLVHKVASWYLTFMNHKLSYDDLVSEGVIGLIKAIEKHDVRKGTQFSTYAVWWIRQAIIRAILDTGTTVRIPVHMFELILKVKKAENRYLMNHQELIPDVICEQLGITRKMYDKAKSVEHQFLSLTSLDQYVSEEDQETALGDFVSGEYRFVVGGLPEKYHDPSLLVEQNDIRARLFDILQMLTPRERAVIIERFGLLNNTPKTLEEISKQYGVTRERIRQIEARALRRIRSHVMKKMSKEDWTWPILSYGG